ncbi:MAG: 4Fe-4S binding protein [Lachnospiraceae bacterium]|nr:4Fe-4S binding protein [Lachnospiraceae bacterium]
MIYSIYFSPTGGTKKAADFLLAAWTEAAGEAGKRAEDVTGIDLFQRTDFGKYAFKKEDVVAVSVPSYGGRVPEIAVKRLQKMTGNGARAVLQVVYGNRDYDDTLLELKETLEGRGFLPWAAVTAVAKHSVVNEIAAGRPDAADRAELNAFGRKIRESLEADWNGEAPEPGLSVKGNHPYREYKGIPLKPKAGKSCTGCGLCAGKCPTGAIPLENPRETDTEICISCMRCIEICPKHARKLNGLMLAVAAGKLKKACGERKGNQCVIAGQ